MFPTATVYLIRHGETNANKAGIIQGQLDVPLNATGKAQAERAASALQDIPFNVAYCSDLCRASDTASTILSHHPSVELIHMRQLRERNMGELQGKKYDPALYHSLPPSVETDAELETRALEWWDQSILDLRNGSASALMNILAVGHGAFISTLLDSLVSNRGYSIGFPVPAVGRRWQIVNASVQVIRVDADGGGILLRCGDDSHLLQVAQHEM